MNSAVTVRPENSRRISPETSVREISLHYPNCRVVFARYGMGGCGGELGPDEPLSFFAQAHNVNLAALIAELEQAAESAVEDTVTPALEFERRLARLYKAYIRSALFITLSFGTAWGAHILAKIALRQSFDAPNYAGTQAHGHAQIYGWVGMFIMGVAYFSIPKLARARFSTLAPAWGAWALMLAGILIRAVAQPLATRPVFGGLLLASAVLELAAVVIFVSDLAGLLFSGKSERQSYFPFIYASLGALAMLAVWNVALVLPLWRNHVTVIPEPANSRFLFLAAFGFIANMILGYSLRLLPIFLGLQPLRQTLVAPAFVAFNAGVLARLAGAPLASGLLVFVGAALYLGALRIFEKPAGSVKARGVDRSFPWFIRLAYFWFAAAVLMVLGGDLYAAFSGSQPAHIYIGAWRHAITVGFVTTIMVGLGYRLLPMFTGVDLWRPGRSDSPPGCHYMMRISFWLLAVGNATRVTFQLATASGERWTYLVMGTSGLMELSALGLFSLTLWKTLGRTQNVLYTEEQISPRTNIRWLLDNFPGAKEELVRAGFCHLQNVKFVPPFVTIQQAAGVHGVDAEAVVAQLRALFAVTLASRRPAPVVHVRP